MIDLETVLNSDEKILVDTCVGNGAQKNDKRLYEKLLGIESYSEIDEDLLIEENQLVNMRLGIISSRNVVIIPEVRGEINRLVRLKLKDIETFEKRAKKENEENGKKQIYLNRIKEKLDRVNTFAGKKLHIIQNPLHESLYYALRLIEDSIDLDPSLSRYKKNIYASQTDLKLVSALYFETLRGNSFSIMSNDKDISRLIGVSARIFSDKNFNDCNNFYKSSFNKLTKNFLYTQSRDSEFRLFANCLGFLIKEQRGNRVPNKTFQELKFTMERIEDLSRKLVPN